MSGSFKFIIGLLICAVIIAFPFFTIKYFEITPIYIIILRYFFIPICILTTIVYIFIYIKKLRKYNKPTQSRIKRLLQDIVNMILAIFILTILFSQIVFSLVIMSNIYLPGGIKLNIDQPVIAYRKGTTKNGRVTHDIKFIDPEINDTISLAVQREYKTGEHFTKKMYRGKWGILYSKD
ncbi:hypothetical protein [Flavobacterium psychrotrophum]|uniref:hypothetical protein n=1 Tax=Flavobacterium psychrotrophum TaxID=2294119 RepID=UPI000E30E8CC|nr:hypothetical protein [Flavobacterium psychrotrophum]